MNERQPYENLIAEKLQQLRGPDVDASWQKMKQLLDDDQSPRGGGGRNNRPNKGWWWLGLGVILLSTALWIMVEKQSSSTENLAKLSPKDKGTVISSSSIPGTIARESSSSKVSVSVGTKKESFNNHSIANSDNTSTNKENNKSVPSSIRNAEEISKNSHKSPAANRFLQENAQMTDNKLGTAVQKENEADEKANKLPKSIGGHNSAQTEVSIEGSVMEKNIKARRISKAKKNHLVNQENKYNTSLGPVMQPFHAMTPSGTSRRHKKAGGKNQPADSNTELTSNQPETGNPGERKGSSVITQKKKNGINRDLLVQSKTKYPSSSTVPAGEEDSYWLTNAHQKNNNKPGFGSAEPSAKKTDFALQQLFYEHLLEEKETFSYTSPAIVFLPGDSMQSRQDLSHLLNKGVKDKLVKYQKEESERLLEKKYNKSFHLDLSNVFKPFSLKNDGEAWWAVGLSLNTALSIAGQNSYHYNVNAKSSVFSDYLPSPYVQFHINDYVYMQTELNLSSPQNIPQLFVSQTAHESGPNYRVEQSIYVQKLYYFNWPFSLHYSPVNNLYIAGGLQFSSLQSGLVLINEKRFSPQGPATDTAFSSQILKFKDDSIAAKLAPNEWRWQTGADYYWNRFTIGFRYNRAFKDLLNVNVTTSLPLTTNRNSSFLFFMRYNLFEGKKKDNASVPKSLVRF